MIVRYHGESWPVELIDGKDYEVISIETDWYRIVDKTDEDYLYSPECFEVVGSNDGTVPVSEWELSGGTCRCDC